MRPQETDSFVRPPAIGGGQDGKLIAGRAVSLVNDRRKYTALSDAAGRHAISCGAAVRFLRAVTKNPGTSRRVSRVETEIEVDVGLAHSEHPPE